MNNTGVVSMADFTPVLKKARLRVTRPRLAVLAAVHENPHADTYTLIERSRFYLPELSHQAVYDSLNTLTEAGILRRIQPSGSLARYEARIDDNHHHIVCRNCGAIADTDCVVSEAPCLSASDDHGFTIERAEVVFWGLCPDCSRGDHAPERNPETTDPIKKERE